jgi:ferritin-like metal-binding protein YciE
MGETRNAQELFLHELGDLLTAERTIEAMLPKLKDEAGDRELKRGFDRHLKETRKHVKTLEKTFESLGAPAKAQPCPGIEGIKREHDEFVSERPPQEVLDVFLTGAAARTEHYEIASYESAISMARALGERDAVELLSGNLKDEKQMLKDAQKTGRRLGRDAAKAARSAGNGRRRSR